VEKPLSENSNVRLGFAVFVLGGAIWWAAALQTKVDNLLQVVTAREALEKNNKDDIAKLETRVTVLEKRP